MRVYLYIIDDVILPNDVYFTLDITITIKGTGVYRVHIPKSYHSNHYLRFIYQIMLHYRGLHLENEYTFGPQYRFRKTVNLCCVRVPSVYIHITYPLLN